MGNEAPPRSFDYAPQPLVTRLICDGAPLRMTILREFGEKHPGQVSGYEIASWIEVSRSCSNEERT
jgi:hypothetical protein